MEIFNLNKDPKGFFDQIVILTDDLFVQKNKKILYKEASSKDIFIWLSQIITLKNTFLQARDKIIANQTSQLQLLYNALNIKVEKVTSKTIQDNLSQLLSMAQPNPAFKINFPIN